MADFELRSDCRHVRWDRPCAPHKARGQLCPGCPDFDPIRHRVLVVKLAATGDVLRTTAFLPAIHAAFPHARVTWITAPGAVPLFAGNRLVDEVLAADSAITAARLQVEHFDAVLCPDADPAAAALAAAARAREHRGFRLQANGQIEALGAAARHWLWLGLDDRRKKTNTRTYQDLVGEVLGLDPRSVAEPILVPSAQDHARAEAFYAKAACARPFVGLNTGAGGRWAYKQWTFEHQAAFLRAMTTAGAAVVLLGGPEEVARHRDLLRTAAGLPVFDAGNHNSLGEFAALVERCRAVVTGDTLAVHVAAARRVPAVVLFGPSSAAEIELYGRGTKLLPEDLDCVCCYLPICDVKPHCQARIQPDRVVAAVAALLAKSPA